MPLKVSDTFFMSGTGGVANPAGAHLMVCLMVDSQAGNAIVVPIVTKHEYSDKSCVLTVGDHPFIKHDSCAAYDHIRSISLAGINADIDNNTVILKTPVSAQVLVKLQIGLVTSDETEPWAFDAAQGDKLTVWLKHKGHL